MRTTETTKALQIGGSVSSVSEAPRRLCRAVFALILSPTRLSCRRPHGTCGMGAPWRRHVKLVITALLTAGLLASVAHAAGSETIRATLKPGEFRTVTTRSSFGAKQTLGVEVRVNGRVVPFTGTGTRSVTAATQSGVVVVVKTARKRGPAQVRMVNASGRKAWVVVEFGW